MSAPYILLVDDEPNILKSLQRLFFEEEYEVTSVSSGQQGLEILETQPVDLIISDYRMPGLSGIEFLSRARKIQPDAVRIILSGFAEIKSLTEAINEGHIYKFVFKPWNDEDLKNTIKLALEQKQLLEENRTLTKELREKNQQLEEFNRQLELKVEERTRELQHHNRVLYLSQEILERIPVSVVGLGRDGIVALMNHHARRYFHPSVGEMMEHVLPEKLVQGCRSLLASFEDTNESLDHVNQAAQVLTIELSGESFLANICAVQSCEGAGGVMVVLNSQEASSEGWPSAEPSEVSPEEAFL